MAKALDIVGERWTLLVVRELLDGPKRYTDLMDGIPGIATDMLAARLKTLEDADLVVRRTLPPPAPATVYELTEFGHGLEPVLHELAKWGSHLLGKRKDEAFRIGWLSMPLRMMFRADRAEGEPITVQFESGGEAMYMRVENGRMETITGTAKDAEVVINGDIATLALAARDRAAAAEAVAKGRLHVTGRKEDIKRAMRILGLRD